MPDEQTTQGTTQSSQGAQGQSASSGASDATGTNTQGSTASQTNTTQTAQSDVASRPDWLPENFYDAKAGPKWDDFGKHFSEVMTRDAAEQSRRLSLPQKPEDVKLDLPKDFKLPTGVDFKMDASKPEFSKFQAAAVKHGLTQDAVTDLMGVYAETLVGSEASVQAWQKAEIDKLGANGPARITALEQFFTGLIGADKAKNLQAMLATAGGVEALESVTAKFSSQGTASFSQAHRAASNGAGIPGYEKMSFEQKRAAQEDAARRQRTN